MQKLELKLVGHKFKQGMDCASITPNVGKDSLLYYNGELIGFFIRGLPKKVAELAKIADRELRSKRVPKTMMKRLRPKGEDEGGRKLYERVQQYSTIIGGCPPKPHMRRPYPSISSVHQKKTAQPFIKAMWLLAIECEQIIKQYMPLQHKKQLQIFESVPKKWKFGNLFTSSISNYNIAAAYHRDAANIPDTVNVIITKRKNSSGGNLHVPDFNAVFDMCDGSMLVYPAWRSLHGVTPIQPKVSGGYRNSLVFYPLKAFLNPEKKVQK